MNVLHIRYALEVARLGSLNKAAESLLVAQPNISRSVKELEAALGIKIFRRSARGMALTEDGAKFLHEAGKIIAELDKLEREYTNLSGKEIVRVSAPLSPSIMSFVAKAHADGLRIDIKEMAANSIIDSVISGESDIGILRYVDGAEKYAADLIKTRGLEYSHLTEIPYHIIAGANSDISKEDILPGGRMSDYTRLILPAALPMGNVVYHSHSIVLSAERLAFAMLGEREDTFMLAEKESPQLLFSLGLKEVGDPIICKDVVIYKKGTKPIEPAQRFISLIKAK